jgi:DNA-binding MurR/RpiR family transcriptional regulator
VSESAQAGEARGDILLAIQASAPRLSPAHRQIAEMILRDPHWSVQSNVEELAARAGVAKPTIVRFARAVGCDGLKDLKLRLAGALALGAGHLHRAVSPGDGPEEVVGKVVGAALTALAQWRRLLDVETLQQAALWLHGARRVDCFGVGATSSFVAGDLQARLFRMGLVANAYSDAYLQLVAAATATARDVVVAISFVGTMPHLIDAAATARAQGAKVIAVTRRDAPLAALADLVLPVDAPDDPTMPVGVDAYVTQLMMIEVLCVLVGRLAGPDYDRSLEHMQKLLRARRRPGETAREQGEAT